MASDPRRFTSETKVGLLFFAGVGLALWFTFSTTDFGRDEGAYSVRFRNVSQLKEGDVVTYNGVKVGVVTRVQPERDGQRSVVRVTFSVEDSLRDAVLVDAGTEFRVVLGMLGGASLDIRSVGGVPIQQHIISQAFGLDAAGLSDAFDSLRTMIEENRKGITQAIGAFGAAMEEIRGLVAENRQVVNSAITNFDRMADQIADLVQDNRETVDAALVNIREMTKQIEAMVKENREDLKQAIAALPAAVQNFRDAAGRVEALLAENREDVRTLMRNLAEVAPKIDRIGTNLDLVTTQMAEGKGTLGKLVMDDQLHDKAVETVDSLDDRLEEVKPITQGLTQLRLAGILGGGINTDTGSGVGYAALRLEPRPWKFFDVGVSYRTAPEDRDTIADDEDFPVNIDLAIGWRFIPNDEGQIYHLHVAGGLIEGQLGAYVLTPLVGQTLSLTAMGRMKDNNGNPLERDYEEGDVMLRSWLEYKPFRRWGISVIAGVDDIIDDPAPWVGIRGQLYDDDFRNLIGVASFGR